MNLESFRKYCLSKKGVTEELPFGENVLVFKVMGKIFALTDMEEFSFVNLKCDPELAVELREQFDFVQPGYHMSKKHWNSIMLESGLKEKQFKEWIDHSYDLVVSKLTGKEKAELSKLK